ncbi:hypothetical protein PCC9214_04740 [Planktothrix tepida]|uniref:DUF305 domain-containing protein n=1 Tax=Planktothrix tepida PCC 9214 TaxID=671072 RepID=A0A1J1LP01_9CYAN|nr:DUF305 domain-containing protein [Planktothrix tepida]CAD5981038.1 hypothetical protein PCC9214_04740 [Planktothrix tepida]CUR33730.1 conserved exported hypothetical protein [Planktothrix tepida PCC 9214]
MRFNPDLLTSILGIFLTLSLGACTTVESSSKPINSSTATPVSSETILSQNHSMMSGNHGMMMDLGPADVEYDLRFIDAMIPHHQGAINMAQQVLQKSTRPEVKKLAEDIIKAQEKEIAQMQQWRKTWYPQAKDAIAYHAAMGHSMPMSSQQMDSMMMMADLGAADSGFDQRFFTAMIPHHQGALIMAKDAQTKSKRSEIQQLAQAILTSQEAEIKLMQQWLNQGLKK